MKDTLTLRQGLDNFYKKYKGQLSHNEKGISKEAQAFFKSHDIAHVLFGCDISLYGEGTVKIWTIFGTTLGFWKHITAYETANAFELAKSFTLADVVKDIVKLFLSIPLVILRAKQMHKLWNWTGFEPYLDIPIVEIRKEFNIRLVTF